MAENEEMQIMDNITKLQEEYYTKNNKNVFFKKNQKYECANMISQQIDISLLFNKTLYVLNKGDIYFDYMMLKTYIHPELFSNFLEYVNKISSEYIEIISQYSLHLNINSLTISAFERYWPLVQQILYNYPVTGTKMQKTYIYYTPSIAEQILKIISPYITNIKNKLVFYSKTESPEKINELFSFENVVKDVNTNT